MRFTGGRNQSGINSNARPLRRRMNAQVDCRSRGIRLAGPLIGSQIIVAIPQKQRCDPAILKLLFKLPREGEGHIFFRKLIAESCAAVIASVARVDHCEVLSLRIPRRRRAGRRNARARERTG